MSDQWLSDDEIRAVAVECGEDERTVRDLADAMQCCAEEENFTTDDHKPQADITCRTAWSAEDNEFVATCGEYPSLSWLASTLTEARQGLERLLENELGTDVT